MSGISKEQITAKLNEVFTATMNNLQGLQELDNTMMNYYSETLALASKELENYTKQMEHHTDVLEHYKNLLSLTGKENDYKALDTVLKG
jgi:predicted O-linked N-acetylglucosamine transferase (SPINDLY family)